MLATRDGDGDARASWPSDAELQVVRSKAAEISGSDVTNVQVVVCPYRICPLGAHIDHQGGVVTSMTINHGILLGFVPSDDGKVLIQSGQFEGTICFRIDDLQSPVDNARSITWISYARGALYALQHQGYHLKKGIVGFISGVEGLDCSGLSSSAAVGIAYLLALETANKMSLSTLDNIFLDKIIENNYLGLENGILDQSAILLGKYGHLTLMDCKAVSSSHVCFSELNGSWNCCQHLPFKVLLAFSGLQHNLPKKSGYNTRVSECKEAAHVLLSASSQNDLEPLLSNVDLSTFEVHKNKLEKHLAKRAEHYFSETERVSKGRDAWARGDLREFGRLMTASGQSSIDNYECGSKEMIQLYEILLKAPGVYGARFSGAGFRGCCLALVDADHADNAAAFVSHEYAKAQPDLAPNRCVLVCEPGEGARIVPLDGDHR